MRHAARKTASKVNKGKVAPGTLTESRLVIHVAKWNKNHSGASFPPPQDAEVTLESDPRTAAPVSSVVMVR